MKKLSLVRLASYVVIIGIAILLRRQIGVIPALLLNNEEAETFKSEPERRKNDQIIVGSAGFRDSKLSGSEVVAIAQRKAREAGQDLDSFVAPNIALSVVEGRLRWIVSYHDAFGWFQFEVRIEDSTGIAAYENTTAPL